VFAQQAEQFNLGFIEEEESELESEPKQSDLGFIEEEESEPEPKPKIEPEPKPKTKKETSKLGLDELRGYAYNNIGNAAAARTVKDYIRMPSLMLGKKFFYAEIEDKRSMAVFGENTTMYLSLDKSNELGLIDYTSRARTYEGSAPFTNYNPLDVGLLNLGLAFESFGVVLNLGFDRTYGTKNNSSYSSIEPGDIIGVSFSMPIEGYLLRFFSAMYNFANSTADANKTVTNQYITADVGFGNFTSAENFYWEAGFFLQRVNAYTESGGKLNADPEARIEAAPFFNVGYKILYDKQARVILGFNNQFAFDTYDHIEQNNYDHTEYALFVEPNILGEILITPSWIAFAEASHIIKFSMKQETSGSNKDNTEEEQEIKFKAIEVSGGVRFQYKHIALEAVLEETFYKNVLQQDWFKCSFGGFIYF
jgi:hypothetical protein